jgi:putative aminopeptidase FrvX
MPMRFFWLLSLAGLARSLAAQAPAAAPSAAMLAPRLATMIAVTGYEQGMVDSLLRLLPGARRDRAGDAIVVIGQGEPRRLVACPLDEPGYVVGNIRADGYLTLRRLGVRSASPLFDQQLEGQRVTVQGRRGALPGVVGVKSVHLTRGRGAGNDEPFNLDNAYVDVGASTEAQVGALGITVLSTVTLMKQPHAYGDHLLAAPVVGRRAACAALVAVALSHPRSTGTTVLAFVVEQNLSRRGLLTTGNTAGPFTETLLVDGGRGSPGLLTFSADTGTVPRVLGRLSRLVLPVRYPDTPVETISLRDADSLAARISEWIGGAR